MITKIENMTYGLSGKILSISAEVALYADDGVTVLHRAGISAKCNVGDGEMQQKLLSDLTAEAQSVKDTYLAVMGTVATFYPTAATPEEAMGLLAADVEGGIK